MTKKLLTNFNLAVHAKAWSTPLELSEEGCNVTAATNLKIKHIIHSDKLLVFNYTFPRQQFNIQPMNNTVVRLVAMAAVFGGSGIAYGQNVYRCGSTFSEMPCGEGQKKINAQANGQSNEHSAIMRAHEETVRKLKIKLPDINPPSEQSISTNKDICMKATRSALKDPESARLEEVVRVGPAYDYDGSKTYPAVSYALWINAKNSYGGYTGKKQWSCVFSADETSLLRVYQIGT
jgi:hypothetical protein